MRRDASFARHGQSSEAAVAAGEELRRPRAAPTRDEGHRRQRRALQESDRAMPSRATRDEHDRVPRRSTGFRCSAIAACAHATRAAFLFTATHAAAALVRDARRASPASRAPARARVASSGPA